MKKLLNFKIILGILLCVMLFEVSAQAQRRRTTSTRRRTPATRTAPTAAALARNAVILTATEKVSNQIKNLSQFIFLLGNSVSAIESLERDIRAGKASQSTRTQAEAGRKGFIATITIFKNAMGDLEDQFRADPILRPYAAQLNGVSEYAAAAEQQAGAGNFNQAGRSLLLVLNQLTDVLREMP